MQSSLNDLPVESSVGKLIDTVEARLLRYESRHASESTDLGELAGKAKRIRQPRRSRSEPELSFEEALAVEELADERLTAGQICIVFNPRSADGMELPGLDLCLDAFPPVRIELFQPMKLYTGQVSFFALYEVVINCH